MRHRYCALFATACAASAMLSAPAAAGTAPVAVTYGGYPQSNACPTYATVEGGRMAPGSLLDVRSGPGSSHGVVDRLKHYQNLFICEWRDGWLGIVYGNDLASCGASRPLAAKQAYKGPCKSGWVHHEFIREYPG